MRGSETVWLTAWENGRLPGKPIIALDATYAVDHPRHPLTGVGVYSRRMLQGLAAQHADAGFRWCYRSHRFWRGAKETRPVNASASPLFERWVPSCDLFHGLNQRMPAQRVGRSVCTFHDLFVMSSDEYSSAEFRERFARQAREAAHRCDLVIAVSAFTASQVHELLGVEQARIRVVHHGVEMRTTHSANKRPVILTVGALQARKNTARLVEAFEQLDAPEWRLVIAGPAGYGSQDILARIEQSPKRASIEVPGFVSDAERQRLYAEASIFAFPSLDEGFGIPVLEAMSHAVPVVTSNRSSLPEVASDAALLVDPLDTSDLGRTLQRLVDDAGLRARLGALGLERARRFTWDEALRKTWSVYEELLRRDKL